MFTFGFTFGIIVLYVHMFLFLESHFLLKQDIQSMVALLSIACYIPELWLEVWI